MAIISDPNLLTPAELNVRLLQERRVEAIDKLYSAHYATVQEFERAIQQIHEQCLSILGPVTDELMSRVAGGDIEKLLIGNEVAQDFFLRSQWMVETAVKMRLVYERHYKSAKNLAKII